MINILCLRIHINIHPGAESAIFAGHKLGCEWYLETDWGEWSLFWYLVCGWCMALIILFWGRKKHLYLCACVKISAQGKTWPEQCLLVVIQVNNSHNGEFSNQIIYVYSKFNWIFFQWTTLCAFTWHKQKKRQLLNIWRLE